MVSTIELPAPVKILKFFSERERKKLTIEEVASGVCEPVDGVCRALDKLVEKELVIKESEVYYYVQTSRSKDLVTKMVTLYEKVKKPPKEEIFKELVSEMFLRPDILEKRLEEEGFDPEEIEELLEEEIEKIMGKKMTNLKILHYQHR
ncbi:MAG: hypothetical protein SVM80_05215 [Halobacteriota archaeon]|nr:hypothetical protein [Halobacteriota archaeon]